MFPRALRREVAALLCLKAAALFLLYQLFFAPAARPELRAADLRFHLLDAHPMRH